MISADGKAASGSPKRQGLILENRKKLTVTGVSDVSGFDEKSVVLDTVMGQLSIKGQQLHINGFSTETGELNLDGEIDVIEYAEVRQNEGGFFSRLFR